MDKLGLRDKPRLDPVNKLIRSKWESALFKLLMRRKLLDFNLNFDREIVGITIISTLLLIIDRYHNFTSIKALDRAFIFLLIPLGIIILAERKSPALYGFHFGDWKAGLKKFPQKNCSHKNRK